MNETIEDQLRRVLAGSALAEIPDDTPIPPLRPVDELAAKRSRRHWLAPLISGVAAATIAVVATLAVVHRSDSPAIAPVPVAAVSHVTVPNLARLGPAQARARLAALHLVMKSVGVESATTEKNEVVGQSPAASVSVPKGSTVTIQVGTGPTFVTVPSRPVPTTVLVTVPSDLVGKTYDQAVAALKAVNLTVTRQVVDGVPPLDTVVKVVGVKPGASVQESTPVIVQTSNNELLVVPNLAGLTPTQAVARLNAAGWVGNEASLRHYEAQTTDSTLIGKVAGGTQQILDPSSGGVTTKPGQNPAAGTKARKSTPFTVVLYAKKQVTVPKFTPGVTTTDGVVAGLQNAGVFNIQVITQRPAVPPAVPNTFISMTPASGSVVDYDAQVTVTVWGDASAPPPTNPLPTTTTK
jgi:beta-lactam-binding protein with PASTA domain